MHPKNIDFSTKLIFGQNIDLWRSVCGAMPALFFFPQFEKNRKLCNLPRFEQLFGELPKKKVIKNGDSNIIFDILIF